MQIVPVLDLVKGQVVRGIAGRRREYRPIASRLCPDARPATLAAALVNDLALREAYVADLDAIGGATPAWEVYRTLIEGGLSLWIDAGLRDADDARRLATFDPHITGVIAGLETVDNAEVLRSMASAIGPERLIFSLDLKLGNPLTQSAAWNGLTPLEIAARAIEVGVRRLIVLDLAQVGTAGGVGTESLCRAIHTRHPAVEIIAGGGVRGLDDLRTLADAGCAAAIVASILHDGRLPAADIANAARW